MSASVIHSVVVTRTIAGGQSGSKSSALQRGGGRSAGGGGSYEPIEEGKYVELTTTGINTVKDAREREKKDMQDLNGRFANYLERVRQLEVLNRGLADELEKLKTRWGKETAQIKALFQAELDEARKNLDDILLEKAKLEIRSTSLEEELEFLSLEYSDLMLIVTSNEEKYKFQIERISDYEREIEITRKSILNFENEKQKNLQLITGLEAAVASARQSLDEETLGHINEENRCQTIQEEIDFLKRLHEQEMKELSGLIYTGAENRDYWKNQMDQAIREIQQMYEDKMDTIKVELESQYSTKVQQMQEKAKHENAESTKAVEETAKIKNEVADMRDKLSGLNDENARYQRELDALRRLKEERLRDLEGRNHEMAMEASGIRQDLDAILRQLEAVVNLKMSLELEIAAYRKLLEGEENRINSKYGAERMVVADLTGAQRMDEEDMYSSSSGELRAKTTFQTSAKGSLAISDCSPDGYCVTVENKGKKAESLIGWKISRVVDGKLEDEFVFNDNYGNVDAGLKIKVWAQGKKPERGAKPLDTEMDTETWGVGSKVITKLYNPEGEERATHNQQTVYTRGGN